MIASRLAVEHVGMVVTVTTEEGAQITDRVVGIYASMPSDGDGAAQEGPTRIEVAFKTIRPRGNPIPYFGAGFFISPESQVTVHERPVNA